MKYSCQAISRNSSDYVHNRHETQLIDSREWRNKISQKVPNAKSECKGPLLCYCRLKTLGNTKLHSSEADRLEKPYEYGIQRGKDCYLRKRPRVKSCRQTESFSGINRGRYFKSASRLRDFLRRNGWEAPLTRP